MALDPQLLEILACPQCKTKVHETNNSLICSNAECRRSYAIKDGIPVMLIDESSILDNKTWQQAIDSVTKTS